MQGINRPALGRSAELGAFYNIRTERFLSDNLFNEPVGDDDPVDLRDDQVDLEVDLVLSDNIVEKFHKLGIEPDLQVSILSGLVEPMGASSFLKEERKSARAARMSLVYKVLTVREEIYPGQKQFREKIDLALLGRAASLGATHVLVGIDWGAMGAITCEDENAQGDEPETVNKSLEAEIIKMKGLLEIGNDEFNYFENVKNESEEDCRNNNKSGGRNLIYYSIDDVSNGEGGSLPVTFGEAVSQARNMSFMVNGLNEGKGIPMSFSLMPLKNLLKKCKVESSADIVYKSLGEESAQLCVQAVEDATCLRQKLYDIQTELIENRNCVPDKVLSEVDTMYKNISFGEIEFKEDLQEILVKVLSKDVETSSLNDFIAKYRDKQLATLNSGFGQFDTWRNKISLVKELGNQNIVYLGRDGKLDLEEDGIVIVLYATNDNSQAAKNSQFYFRKLHSTYKADTDYKFYWVDTVMTTTSDQKVKRTTRSTKKSLFYTFSLEDCNNTIQQYIDGHLIMEDMFKENGKDSDMCLVEIPKGNRLKHVPNDRAVMKLVCPSSVSCGGECKDEVKKWFCKKCKDDIWFSKKMNIVFCMNKACQVQCNPKKVFFCCDEIFHGVAFVPHEPELLNVELPKLKVIDIQNILILGETGVGKSTWINGIANYLVHSSLEEALVGKPVILIPAKFTITDDEGKMIDVKVGTETGNEDMSVGNSSTQDPVTYQFVVGDKLINLIDTPGIGDTRGQDQDKKNFEKILHHISQFDEIHAICILLKPNNSKMGVVFRFCIQELLAHLHRDAARNILFCFTNTRGTDYRPGDTLKTLKELLGKFGDIKLDATPDNWFCFDNEAFRFLARVLNKLPYTEVEINRYATSWTQSVEETLKLFNHENLKHPHRILNTLSVNDARRTIVTLGKPMAAFITEINNNINSMNEFKKKIADKDTMTEALRKDEVFTGTTLEQIGLDHPRTVCTADGCVEYMREDITDQHDEHKTRTRTIYKQLCHRQCSLKGVDVDAIGAQGLYYCGAMRDGKCKFCNHMWDQHMHLRYELKVVTKQFIDDKVRKKMAGVASEIERMVIYKTNLDVKIGELQREHDDLIKMSAEFGAFLKKNAIIPYNDSVADYLDYFITEEAKKNSLIRDENKIIKLTESRERYMQEKKILDQVLDGEIKTGSIPSPEELKGLIQKMFKMKHFGKDIRQVFEGIERDGLTASQVNQVNVSARRNNMNDEDDMVTLNQNHGSWIKQKFGNTVKNLWKRF